MTRQPTPDSGGSSDWASWIGRSQEQHDVIDAGRAARLQVTLDDPFAPLREGDTLPPLWHWSYFPEQTRTEDLGPDGLAVGAGLLPPIDLPRIMWAGSRVSFPAPLSIGREAVRRSTILGITEKEGRSGRLCFVTLRHEVIQEKLLCIDEEMDVVYRDASDGPEMLAPGRPAPPATDWRRQIVPSPVLLFRYSALTWNSHRIHYDRDYVTAQEGYPGLIVHGPLLATLMIDQIRRQRPAVRVSRFAFSALRPVFDAGAFTLAGIPAGDSAALWVADSDGFLAMDGSASFDP